MAIEQSHDLCRVITSHHAVMMNAKGELDRIFDELQACSVPVPSRVGLQKVQTFVDSSLQHGKTPTTECDSDITQLKPPQSLWDTKEYIHIELYRDCMKVYCSMNDRSAFKKDFDWNTEINV